MASLYKRPGSPYWWIKYQAATKVRRESTGLRFDDRLQTHRAHEIKAQKALAEVMTTPNEHDEHWDRWVLRFLQEHAKCAATLRRHIHAWSYLLGFFDEHKIMVPRQLTHTHCRDYCAWRQRPDPARGGFVANINSVRGELSTLSLIMSEAVRRSFSPANPATNLRIPSGPRKVKPELTNEHLTLIEQALERGDFPASDKIKDFLRISFLIGRYQGCRLSETHLNPLTDVNIAPDGLSGRIHFRIKGGRDHAAPLHPKLIPLFQRLRAEGRTETYDGKLNKAGNWARFLDHTGLRAKLPPGACFHCLRVTAVTRLARDKTISMAKAMRYIGHASVVIHQVYQRLHCEDLDDCLAALD